jgi:hypothetical protein
MDQICVCMYVCMYVCLGGRWGVWIKSVSCMYVFIYVCLDWKGEGMDRIMHACMHICTCVHGLAKEMQHHVHLFIYIYIYIYSKCIAYNTHALNTTHVHRNARTHRSLPSVLMAPKRPPSENLSGRSDGFKYLRPPHARDWYVCMYVCYV